MFFPQNFRDLTIIKKMLQDQNLVFSCSETQLSFLACCSVASCRHPYINVSQILQLIILNYEDSIYQFNISEYTINRE
jgi:sulfite reductase beta subunit-like hemoprotein